ncbi:ATPase [Dehalococcoides mccartyi CG4]|uniref:PAS domain-containing sensor histidine kinase n=1 Tax=Dehalococcoides mccartyi TaxID=61435 RepID=UPI0004E04594|nr:PAS domain S-box protein [Dehalococcoides mccartyi]AII58857.1 ATPase [Dehalococcoides mccartyi CG4]
MSRKVLGEKQLPTQEVLPANDLMISGIRDSVFIADLNGKIVFANDQACKVHGYTKDEFKGLNVIDIVPPERVKEVMPHINKVKAQGYSIHNSIHRCKNGEIKISEISLRLIEMDNHEYILALFKDISEFQTKIQTYVAAQEKEREWVSIEIHDRIVQNLSGILHQINALTLCKKPFNKDKRDKLDELSGQLNNTIIEARSIMRELYPGTLTRYGLIRLIQEESIHLQDEMHCEIKFNHSLTKAVPPYLETTIYRIVHEALLNAKKYSQASQIVVDLNRTDKNISLDICDNGIGFCLKNVDWIRPSGLQSMRQRAEIVSGTFCIRSGVKGTCIHVLLPIINHIMPTLSL